MNNKFIKGAKRTSFNPDIPLVIFPLRLQKDFHNRIEQVAVNLKVSKHKLILDAITEYIKGK